MIRRTRKFVRHLVVAGLGAALIGMLVLWPAERMALNSALEKGELRADSALRLTEAALAGHLARYENVPALLADHEIVRGLVEAPDDPAHRIAANTWLAAKNAALQSLDIYVMRRDGETVAASNHGRAGTFLGQNFRYRPYFADALAGGAARFYAIGTTSGVRGYFFSAPVFDSGGEVAGVIALKVGLEGIEASWQGGEYRIFVTDPEGIVFMSSEPGWLFRGLAPLTEERLARTEYSRRYSDTVLGALGPGERELGGVRLVSLPLDDGEGRAEFIDVSRAMPEADWTVHVLLDAAPLRAQARLWLAVLGLMICAAGFAALVLLQRRARTRERLELQARAREELEQRVEERTADLARVNRRLGGEVAERKATEKELRRTQARLVQAGKLAALGQMSAAVSHEINQPLAAARNYADSAAILIERGDSARARENVNQILALIDRMAAIGQHLRNMARKPNERLVDVALAEVVEDTLLIAAPRLAAAGVVVERDLPPGLPRVRAGAVRLQQVLANLLANAADAVEGHADRRLTLTVTEEGGRVAIRLRDRGPGVPAAIAERIFDPFFTTKGVGAGLGLGLSISYNIIRDFGGEIRVRNLPAAEGGGAEFTVLLDAAPAREAAA